MSDGVSIIVPTYRRPELLDRCLAALVGQDQQKKSMFDALLYKKHPELFREKIAKRPPWHYYYIVGSFLLGVVASALDMSILAAPLFGLWAFLVGRFCASRLRGTRRTPNHVAEMVCTSIVIPWVSVYWRLYGAYKFKVVFA